MMILDGHIHIEAGEVKTEALREKMRHVDVAGGVLLSMSPNSFTHQGKQAVTAKERIENLMCWCAGYPNLYPFYWIDPTESDAADQVRFAVEEGVSGFKVICNHFYPDDPQALKIYAEIAKKNKPILFHSGILWDGAPSSVYNRPGGFEGLLCVDGLRFSLAHVSWPWHDECIAVYGKLLNAYVNRSGMSVEMFIDITPGTPPIYREEVLTKLLTVGYDVENNIIFGTDSNTADYNEEWAGKWIERDDRIYDKLGIDEAVRKKIYAQNLKRFLGISEIQVKKRYLKSGE